MNTILGRIPPELHDIINAELLKLACYLISDAFTSAEMEQLTDVRRMMAITYSAKKACDIEHYLTEVDTLSINKVQLCFSVIAGYSNDGEFSGVVDDSVGELREAILFNRL